MFVGVMGTYTDMRGVEELGRWSACDDTLISVLESYQSPELEEET